MPFLLGSIGHNPLIFTAHIYFYTFYQELRYNKACGGG